VAWDHSVPDYRVELKKLVTGSALRHDYIARLTGGDDPPGPISEEILRDIAQSDCVLAFLERPNCNVLFEAGYALGLGKGVQLRVYSDRTRDRWVDGVRWVSGLPIKHLPANPPWPRLAIERFDTAVEHPPLVSPPPARRAPAAGSVVLCPTENPGQTLRDELELQPRLCGRFSCPPPHFSYTRQLAAIETAVTVAWVIPYLTLPDSRHLPAGSFYRDHPENAANAFLAGFAHGRGIPVRVFQQKGAGLRRLLDLDALEISDWLDTEGLIDTVTDHLPAAKDRFP
jgi:hypothetical protein